MDEWEEYTGFDIPYTTHWCYDHQHDCPTTYYNLMHCWVCDQISECEDCNNLKEKEKQMNDITEALYTEQKADLIAFLTMKGNRMTVLEAYDNYFRFFDAYDMELWWDDINSLSKAIRAMDGNPYIVEKSDFTTNMIIEDCGHDVCELYFQQCGADGRLEACCAGDPAHAYHWGYCACLLRGQS